MDLVLAREELERIMQRVKGRNHRALVNNASHVVSLVVVRARANESKANSLRDIRGH